MSFEAISKAIFLCIWGDSSLKRRNIIGATPSKKGNITESMLFSLARWEGNGCHSLGPVLLRRDMAAGGELKRQTHLKGTSQLKLSKFYFVNPIN